MNTQMFFFIILTAGLVLTTSGLELTRDLEHKTVPGGKKTCGVVRCLEQGEHPSVSEISNMVMFRQRADSSAGPVKIASISTRQPHISRVWDRVKVEGLLEKEKAQITIYLTEEEDCHSTEYSCHVRFVDGVGEERLGTSSVGKPEATRTPLTADTTGDVQMPENNALQLSAIIQQSHISVENTLRQLQTRFEDSARGLENRIEDKLSEIAEAVTGSESSSTTSIENELLPSETSISLLKEQLENVSSWLLAINKNVDLLQKGQHNIKQRVGLVGSTWSSFQSVFENRVQDIFVMSLNNSKETQKAFKEAVSSSETTILDKLGGLKASRLSVCKRKNLTTPSLKEYQVIHPEDSSAPYLCDTVTDGGGWIVIQRRSTGDVDFFLKWTAYKTGFGSLDSDFWLGNDRIHALTSQDQYELMVSLTYKGTTKFARYSSFSLGDENNKYKLNLGSYSGTAGDSLSHHRGMAFSTLDKDHDEHKTLNCAEQYKGAWWYKSCHSSNLNGKWNAGSNRGPRWSGFTSSNPVTYSEMKIRRLSA